MRHSWRALLERFSSTPRKGIENARDYRHQVGHTVLGGLRCPHLLCGSRLRRFRLSLRARNTNQCTRYRWILSTTSVSQRAVDDGFEYQAIRDADGQLAVELKPVPPEEQRYFLPLGRFNPNQIIIGKPPFPELEGAKVIGGEPPKHLLNKSPLLTTTPWGTKPILDEGAQAIPGGGTEATQAGMTYQPLASSFSLSYSHSLATVYGTAVLPYPETPGSPLQKPAGTNHQWISFDFVASNYFSNASGQTAGSHVPIVMYRWSQFSAYAIAPPNTYVGSLPSG